MLSYDYMIKIMSFTFLRILNILRCILIYGTQIITENVTESNFRNHGTQSLEELIKNKFTGTFKF